MRQRNIEFILKKDFYVDNVYGNQVAWLNSASLKRALSAIPSGLQCKTQYTQSTRAVTVPMTIVSMVERKTSESRAEYVEESILIWFSIVK
jgi:hypothetical protein